jgi:hypothetical protein
MLFFCINSFIFLFQYLEAEPESDELWCALVERDHKQQKKAKDDDESFRDFYWRLVRERDTKLSRAQCYTLLVGFYFVRFNIP